MKLTGVFDVSGMGSHVGDTVAVSATHVRSGGFQFIFAWFESVIGAGATTFDATATATLRDSGGTVLATYSFSVTFDFDPLGSGDIVATAFSPSLTWGGATLPGPNSDSLSGTVPAYEDASNFQVTSPVLMTVIPAGAYVQLEAASITSTYYGTNGVSFGGRGAAKPTAAYSVTSTGGDATFDTSASTINNGVGSSDAGYLPLTYALDPGDGSGTITQTTSPILHTYDADGTYTSPLIVTDQYGGWDDVSHSVAISGTFTQHGSFIAPDGALHTAANSGGDVQVRVFPQGVASAVSRAVVSGAKNPSYCRQPRGHKHYLMTQNSGSGAWELRSSTDQGRVFA